MTDPNLEVTVLDQAHGEMSADETNHAARLKFFERLADAELFLLLAEDPKDDVLIPRVFDLEDGPVVLTFDREERLANFAGKTVPYAAMSGRMIIGLLNGQELGMGMNLGVSPSSTLLPVEAITWLAETLDNAPDEAEARPSEFHPPSGLPEALITALDAKLATATGLARFACLVGVTYEDNAKGHLLGFVDAVPDAQPALARAVAEALTFSGIEAGALDVGFFAASDPFSAPLVRHGLRFDLPEAVDPDTPRPAPGSDPDKPPKLR